jgi:hypothetical protein
MAFQRFRSRKTPVRKPSFCEDFCEEATRHKITSRRVTEEFNYTTLPLISSNPPYATFLFLSAAQAYWWSRLTDEERYAWLKAAQSVDAADAWEAYKRKMAET